MLDSEKLNAAEQLKRGAEIHDRRDGLFRLGVDPVLGDVIRS